MTRFRNDRLRRGEEAAKEVGRLIRNSPLGQERAFGSGLPAARLQGQESASSCITEEQGAMRRWGGALIVNADRIVLISRKAVAPIGKRK